MANNCEGCPFRSRTIGPIGSPTADLVFVGESPGKQEVKEGRPFIGPSGKILWETFPGGEDLDKMLVTNAMACFPRGKKDQVRVAQGCHSCNSRLMEEVSASPRKLIVALGNAAVWSLTGNYKFKILANRGRLIPSELAEYGILPVVHPAALMRGTGSFRQFQQDMRAANDLIQGAPPRTFPAPSVTILHTELLVKLFCYQLLRIASSAYPLELGADIETSGFDRRHDRILCIGVAHDPSKAYIIPPHLMYLLAEIVANLHIKWVWHNGKFDTAFLIRDGFKARVDEDTMLESYTLDETGGVHDLDQVAFDVLNAPSHKGMLKQYLPKKDSSYELVPKEVLYKYLGFDVSKTIGMHKHLRRQISEDARDEKLYTRTLLPASELLEKVEKRGILVDMLRVSALDKIYSKRCDELEKSIWKIAGHPVNPRSPKQVAEVIYIQFKLKSKHRDTTKETLERMAPHPFVKALLKYRKVQKAHSTYIKARFKDVSDDGRVHSTYKIHGTRTGRLSSAEPNMQNIPRDSKIRGMFIAPPKRVLVGIDLNQAELRSLACMSGDPTLCEIYSSTDRSLHVETSIAIFGEDYTSEDKMRAKGVNFGIIYGREAPSLAEEFGVSIKEAQRWIDGWGESYPVAWDFIKMCRKAPAKNQTMFTSFGRKKRHRLVTSELLRGMMNEAANFPHQSAASDINLHSAIEADPHTHRWDSIIINLIHDEILFECPAVWKLVDGLITYVTEIMERKPIEWGLTRIPFKAEAKIGYRWGSAYMHEYNIGEHHLIRLDN